MENVTPHLHELMKQYADRLAAEFLDLQAARNYKMKAVCCSIGCPQR